MVPILEVRGIKKKFNDGKESEIQVIKGVDFSINKGEKVAIIGASGSGKSTLINLFGQLLKADDGEFFVNNKNVSNLSRKEIAQLRNEFFGYIVQEFALVEEDTSYQNVEIPLLYSKKKLSKVDKKKYILKSLEKVGLLDKVNEKVKNLSGGQRQRVAIARAIVNTPDIILADEPTGSLDANTSKKIISLLDSLVCDGKSLILVTHNKELASSCDKIYLIENGLLKIID